MPGPRGQSQQQRASDLGAQIRRLRRARKLTQRALAERVPMSAANLSRIENGEQGPPADEVLVRMADALDVDAGELLQIAGRAPAFESVVLAELRSLHAEMRAGFDRLERALTGDR